jgi:hypothetical protein
MTNRLSAKSIHFLIGELQTIKEKIFLQVLGIEVNERAQTVKLLLSDGFHRHSGVASGDNASRLYQMSKKGELATYCVVQLGNRRVHWPLNGPPQLEISAIRVVTPPRKSGTIGKPKAYVGSGSYQRSSSLARRNELLARRKQFPLERERSDAATRFLKLMNSATNCVKSGRQPVSVIMDDVERTAREYVAHVDRLRETWRQSQQKQQQQQQASTSSSPNAAAAAAIAAAADSSSFGDGTSFAMPDADLPLGDSDEKKSVSFADEVDEQADEVDDEGNDDQDGQEKEEEEEEESNVGKEREEEEEEEPNEDLAEESGEDDDEEEDGEFEDGSDADFDEGEFDDE